MSHEAETTSKRSPELKAAAGSFGSDNAHL